MDQNNNLNVENMGSNNVVGGAKKKSHALVYIIILLLIIIIAALIVVRARNNEVGGPQDKTGMELNQILENDSTVSINNDIDSIVIDENDEDLKEIDQELQNL